MTVYELIEELKKYPQAAKVTFCAGTEKNCWYTDMKPGDITVAAGVVELGR